MNANNQIRTMAIPQRSEATSGPCLRQELLKATSFHARQIQKGTSMVPSENTVLGCIKKHATIPMMNMMP